MTSPRPFVAAEWRARVAGRLWPAAIIVLAFMPVGMAIAHRSSPVFLVTAALLALLGTVLEGEGRAFVDKVKSALAAPPGRTGLGFFAWSFVSIAWSAFPAVSLAAFGEFWIPVLAALALGLALPGRVPKWSWWLFAGALALACAMILFELNTGLSLRRDLGMRSASFIFNRPVLTILVGAIPVLVFLATRPAPGWLAAVPLAGLALVAAASSESGASGFGLAVAAAVFAASCLAPGLVRRAAMVGVVAVLVAAPFLGAIGDRLIPSSVHQGLSDSHSRDRIDIWMSFGAAIRQQPLLGGGFGVSPRMAETPVAAAVPAERRTLLGVGHPHNAAVQIWAELGVVGAALAAAVLVLTLLRLAGLPRRRLAAALSLLALVAAVSLVGHGAWQGWWAAAVGAAVAWFRSLPSSRHKAIP